jgi:copper oxidase (laccase) domain-containing protein
VNFRDTSNQPENARENPPKVEHRGKCERSTTVLPPRRVLDNEKIGSKNDVSTNRQRSAVSVDKKDSPMSNDRQTHDKNVMNTDATDSRKT